MTRFAGRDAFAAGNGTAPMEVSSGERKANGSRACGNRKLNYAIHMAWDMGLSARRWPRGRRSRSSAPTNSW